jgi:hypothetical protein
MLQCLLCRMDDMRAESVIRGSVVRTHLPLSAPAEAVNR